MSARPTSGAQAGRSDARTAPPNDRTRRQFLGDSLVGLGALGAGLAARGGTAESGSVGTRAASGTTGPIGAPRIRSRRPLGRTGLEIPDIAMGTFSLDQGEALVHHALERGITHFDTAESYADGRAEEVLGRALRGRRDGVTLTSKYSAAPNDSAERQMAVLERSLRRLGTETIDVYLNHAVNDVERLDSPAWQSFVERAKRQGKIRFAGLSGHAGRLTECLAHGLDTGLLDVVLVAYHFAQTPSYQQDVKRYLAGLSASFDFVSPQPGLPALLERAHAAGVGVMVMKTLRGARLNDMRPFESPGRTFAQAAFRWVLSERAVDGLVVSMTSRAMIDEYVEASGSGPPDREDLALLARYESRHARTTCTIGCGDCLAACPAGVPIPDVMRTRMYAEDYGLPRTAAREYARLPVDATACLACSGEPCHDACPVGLPIDRLNRATHRRLA
ncbi:MAG: aldo/keto reductase [Myxococcota bacterium]